MNNSSPYNIKLLVTLLVLVITASILSFVYVSYQTRNHNVEVRFVVAPQDTTVTYGSAKKTISTGDLASLKPGSYEFNFSKDGFKSSKTIVQLFDSEEKNIAMILEPENEEATNEMASGVNRQAIEDVSQVRYIELEQSTEILPVSSWLPFENFLYSIDYRVKPDPKNPNDVTIQIEALSGYRQSAIYQLSRWGYNPANFEYLFIGNYRNPFAS